MLKILLLVLLSSTSFAKDYVAGKDYQMIPISALAPGQPHDKIQVLEFFSYTCHWCQRVQTAVPDWQQTLHKNTEFRQVPVVFGQQFLPYAKAFYLAEQSKNPAKMHTAVFNYIQDNNKRFVGNQDLEQFFQDQGMEKYLISSLLSNSIALEATLKRDEQVLQAYKIIAIPSFVVAGRYRVDPSMVQGDLPKLFKIVDYLIKKAQVS